MLFVTTVKYSIVTSGHTLGPITPSRGLRQGDPLSPYLFIICAEGLSAILNSYEEKKLIHGCRIAPTSPFINHLLFADDCCLFFEAKEEEALSVKQCLYFYERASGQAVNFNKSSIVYSPNISEETRSTINTILGVSQCVDHGKYLGAPSLIGRDRKKVFSFVKEKVSQRLFSWKNRMLTRAGKEVLIKSVIQAIPSYVMSVFILPLSVCTDIESYMSRFWWSTSSNERGMTWQKWDKLCAKKQVGGLSFRKIHYFNIALLAKQGWRLLTKPDSLFTAVFKGRYFPESEFVDAPLGTNPSYGWRSLWLRKR